ncbi:hypothetical protein JAAARDRAFT_193604 [Jaapia argillacea MUCL 33604]|uniref:Uncharacterized protein n=1 Tax=Jaapia argillacea MUCL 33604 TaxID=933084 RepID=A0A067PWB5_9AGAM|nr:hypothetical protein JAAARDRAFT_193604 [Jaapia argillacea MUCL 33604]
MPPPQLWENPNQVRRVVDNWVEKQETDLEQLKSVLVSFCDTFESPTRQPSTSSHVNSLVSTTTRPSILSSVASLAWTLVSSITGPSASGDTAQALGKWLSCSPVLPNAAVSSSLSTISKRKRTNPESDDNLVLLGSLPKRLAIDAEAPTRSHSHRSGNAKTAPNSQTARRRPTAREAAVSSRPHCSFLNNDILRIVSSDTNPVISRFLYLTHDAGQTGRLLFAALPSKEFKIHVIGAKKKELLAAEVLDSPNIEHARLRLRIADTIHKNGGECGGPPVDGERTLIAKDVIGAFSRGEEHVSSVKVSYRGYDWDFATMLTKNIKTSTRAVLEA